MTLRYICRKVMTVRRNHFVSLGHWFLVPLKSLAYVFKTTVLSYPCPGDSE